MTRPRRLVVCLGTATGVGKTWLGAAVLADLRRRGAAVSARKPAQSFAPDADEPTDAQVLASASGERSTQVVPEHRSYPVALAPPMAAARLGWPAPLQAQLLDELRWTLECDLGWLETVGGVRSPIAADADSLALVDSVVPDRVVLVGDSSLGAIGAVMSALDSLSLGSAHSCPQPTLAARTMVFLNRFDPADPTHAENRSWLSERLTQPIHTEVTRLAGALIAAGPQLGSPEVPSGAESDPGSA